MKILQKPKNSWSLALYILHDTYATGTSQAKVLLKYSPVFYKFQSRLNEIIAEYPNLEIEKTNVPFTSRLTGNKSQYTHYKCLSSRRYLVDIYNRINERGMAGKTNKPEMA